MTPHATIIVNPVSGKGKPLGRLEEMDAIAKSQGWQGEVLGTTNKLGAELLARHAIKNGSKHIVICGGDGTIMESLPALVDTDAVLGIVPKGTGNLFAINLGIPTDSVEAMKVALFGKPIKVDVGRANETYFGIMAGIGWDAAVIRDTTREVKDRFGHLAYFLSGIQHLSRPRGLFSVVIDSDTKLRIKAKSILVANMGRIQTGIEAVPEASPNNGQLKIGIVKAGSLKQWLNMIYHAYRTQIDSSPHYDLYEGKHIEITSLNRPQPIELDGNDLPPVNKLVIDIKRESLNVLVNQLE